MMRIAITLAIFVVFASGTYAAFADEPIPEIIFEGGDYEISRGGQILIPIKIEVENHDHTIVPKILTIYENQVIKTSKLAPSHSGSFVTFIILNENYKSGEYFIQLDYDGNKSNPEPFTLSKGKLDQHEERTKTIVGYFNLTREPSLKLSSEKIRIDFSYPYLLDVSGNIGQDAKGFVYVKIFGPKSYTNEFPINSIGDFQGKIIIDRFWPSGTYVIGGYSHGKEFASKEFTVNNVNEIKDKPDKITGTMKLESVSSGMFGIILIDGELQNHDTMEKIGIKVSKDGDLVDFLTVNIQQNGKIDTSLVLYDYSAKSPWQSGKYTVEFTDLSNKANLDSISSPFIITEGGLVISDLSQGVMIVEDDLQRLLVDEEIIDYQNNVIHKLTVFGNVELLNLPGTLNLVEISINNPDTAEKKYNVYTKNTGEYSLPLIVDSSWPMGKYDIDVTYQNITRNIFSFNFGEPQIEIQMEEAVEIVEKTIVPPEKFDLTFDSKDGEELLNFNFAIDENLSGGEKIKVILEGPDGFNKIFYISVNDEKIDVPVLVHESWPQGDYKLSFNSDGGVKEFGKFTITKDKTESDIFILNKHLEYANPDLIYPSTDEFLLGNDQVILTRGTPSYLKLSGSVADYNSGYIEIEISRGDKIFSVSKIKTPQNGKFSDMIKINNMLKSGFYEISAFYDDRKFATSEFLIIEQKTIPGQFGSKPIKISRDMFEESGGLVKVKLTGPINDFGFIDIPIITFTILKPDGKMETFETGIKKWGYFLFEIPVTSEWQNGTYIVSAKLEEKNAGHMYLQITDYDMEYVKNVTSDWVDSEISTFQYTNRLNAALENNETTFQHIESKMIPDWFKNTAKLWIDETMTEDEFIQSLKFLTIS